MSWCGVRAGVWLAGGWGVRLGVGVSLGPCRGGLGVPPGLAGRVGVRGVALPGGLCLGPVSSGGSGPWPWSLWPFSSAACEVALVAAGVVAWR